MLFRSTTVAKATFDGNSFKKVFTSGAWLLYQVNGETEPEIMSVPTAIGYTGSEAGASYFAQTIGTVISPGDDAFEAECVMCNPDEYHKLVDSIVLPKTRITPGSIFFGFELWQENRLLARVKNIPSQRIDADLALALKYRSWGSVEKSNQFLRDSLSTWKGLAGRDSTLYAIRLGAYFQALGQTIPGDLSARMWMSESGIYRYISPVREGYIPRASGDLSLSKNFTNEGLEYIEVKSSGPAPFVFLEKTPIHTLTQANISFQKINPTKYIARVQSEGPFLIELKEQFDPRWKLSVPGKHVEVDGFANGWIVDKKGSFDVEITYAPQTYFYIGLWISGVAMISSIYYMVKHL